MSWCLLASIAAAALAGALLPRPRGRGLDRLRPADAGRGVPAPGLRRERLPARLRQWLLRSRDIAETRAALIELADALAAELRAGAAPREALWRSARDQPRFVVVAAAARSPTGDVVSALQEVATHSGVAAAGDLATAWAVCESTGGRLAAPVARLAGGWRDEEQVRREVSAQLAGPRATAVLLAALPVVGVAMGGALGADPVRLLRQPSVGLLVLAPGLLLEVAGLLWTAQITRHAATW